MKHFFLKPLTRAIDSYLQLDPESSTRLKRLNGKVLTIELLPFHFRFQCCFHEQGIEVTTDETQPADAKLTGTPLQLAGVAITKEERHRYFADDLEISGNAEIGQQAIALFDELQIDWEEKLSHLIGDVPSYHINRLINGMSKWLHGADQSMSENISEYLHEEKEWFPTRAALQDFFNDIDTLREDVDRIEARMQLIRAQLTKDEEGL